jgi:pyruvate-formate lyase-activating enzyme
VATEDLAAGRKMDHDKAKEVIVEMARASVGGISFSAGEPFLYFNKIAELVKLCRELFNSPETLTRLRSDVSQLEAWSR